MPKYHVYGHVVGTKYLGEFEAETPEEAENKGMESDAAYISLCHECAGKCGDDFEIETVHAEEA